MSSRATRACEPCRVRKVKCNGATPCSQCAHLNLSCIYSTAPSKRKPGVRGRLVAQLRQGTTDSRSSTTPPQVQDSPTGSGLYTADFFLNLITAYEDAVFPVNPIISSSEIVAAVENMEQSFEDSALVFAFGAVTINLSELSQGVNDDTTTRMTDLMHHSFRAHRQAELGSEIDSRLPVTVKRIMTCIFLEICLMALKRFDRSLAILREAIAMIQMLQVDQNVSERRIDDQELARRQRLYWEAFIHERFLTIMPGYPSQLPPLRTGVPLPDWSIPQHVKAGFDRLIHLFLIMDDTFLSHWRALQDPELESPQITSDWIESKQAQLDEDEIGTAETEKELICGGYAGLSELQHADLFVTRLWLRTLVWQLALSQGLLQSVPPKNSHEGFSMHFPTQRLSAQLRNLVGRLDRVESIGIHGSGILQKLFDITSTVADVLALPIGHEQDAESRIEDFLFLVNFLLSFERIPPNQKEYLKEKVNIVQREHASGFHSLAVYTFD